MSVSVTPPGLTASDWPSPSGPFSGNAAYDSRLNPPLTLQWEHPVGSRYGDGLRVAGRGHVVIPVQGRDIECLDLATGERRWRLPSVRVSESECYLVGDSVWSAASGHSASGIRVSRIQLESGTPERFVFPCFIPIGPYSDAIGLLFRQRECAIRLIDLKPIEAPTFFGRIHAGWAYGALDDGSGKLRSSLRGFGLRCFNAATGESRWSLPPEAASEYVVAIGEEVLVTFSFAREIRARASADGNCLWRHPTGHVWDTLAPVVIARGLVYRWEGHTLIAQHAQSGETVWTMDTPGYRTNMVATQGLLWVGLEKSGGRYGLTALDSNTGKVIWETRVQGRAAGSALAFAEGSLLVLSGRTLRCLRAATSLD